MLKPTEDVSNDDNNEIDNESKANKETSNFKNDIFIKENIRREGSSHKSMLLNQKPSSFYSPKSCPICLETYNVGDDIAWSKNEACPHAFHLDCIKGWLMTGNDDCPLCRQDYLFVENNV